MTTHLRSVLGLHWGVPAKKKELVKTCLLSILMISDQCTYTCLRHDTPFYAFNSDILTFAKFPDFPDW